MSEQRTLENGEQAPTVVKTVGLTAGARNGTAHEYEVRLPHTGGEEPLCRIRFQQGALAEIEPNGVREEDLLAILIDRLEVKQSGALACDEFYTALSHLEQAMGELNLRTLRRVDRGVEGTSEL